MPADDGGERAQDASASARSFQGDTDVEPGDGTVERFGFEFHPVVVPVSIALVASVVAVTVTLGEDAATWYGGVSTFVDGTFGSFYVLAMNAFVLSLSYFGISKYGRITLGAADADPEFSTASWLSMLFTAGMGIGLLFFGVAEPMYHFLSGGGSFFHVPPESPAAGRAATALTMFHWGFHPWAVYGVVGLGLAFFAYNRGLPLSFRSVLYPVLGDRVYGWPGHAIDLAAVVATVFGLATTTGLAAVQINAGLDFLARHYFGTGVATDTRSAALVVVVLVGGTTLSVVAGLERGIERLSRLNVGLMLTLLLFVGLVGPTVYLLDVFNAGVGAYLGNLLELSFYTEAFADGDAGWQHDWTIFYWGFWTSWAPFVGLFLARISKGRTVRQFVAGVLFVPAAFSLVWMAVFGGASLFVELEAGGGITGPLQEYGRGVALFELLSHYPLTAATSVVATATLVTFFVTSTDSGSLAISYLATGGKHETTTRQRVVWPVLFGATAGALLLGNGLAALQTAVTTAGLPFATIALVTVYTTYRGLERERAIRNEAAPRDGARRSDEESAAAEPTSLERPGDE